MMPVGVDLVQPGWAALATAFGASGRRVERRDDIASSIRAAIADGGVQLVHIPQHAL
jgi:acetolactate synthase-1/2/3 large subunit